MIDVFFVISFRNLKQERLRKMQRRIMKQGEPDAELSDSSDSDADQDMEFEGGFRVPGNIWKKLYRSVTFGTNVHTSGDGKRGN